MKVSIPSGLKDIVKKDILLSFKTRNIVTKFLLFQFLGAALSLSFCPQFGLGLMEGHGITHVFRLIGDWACAVFCGSLFLSSGTLLAILGMKGEEVWWIWRRFKVELIFLPALLWGALMLFNLTPESPVYHLSWIAAAMTAQVLWLKGRAGVYLQSLKT